MSAGKDFRRLLDEKWAALHAEPVSGERRLRVARLPVVADRGALIAAVDLTGHRHLLVPIHSHRKVRSELNGPVLQMRKRPLEDADSYQNYVDLACLRDDLDDLFTNLCVDVLHAVVGLPENPVKGLYTVLDRWKALFQTPGDLLRGEQLAGLFGELTLLNRLLRMDPSAHRLWRGPQGYRHDFAAETTAVEVKASAAGEGRRPRIHGLDQLEAPEGGRLVLVWYRLHRGGADGPGTAFVDVVDLALSLCDDEPALLRLLASAGYRLSDADRYHDVHFSIVEERWYGVDEFFPGLTARALAAAGVPVSVLDVEYTVDLSGETPAPLLEGEATQVIETLIQEPM